MSSSSLSDRTMRPAAAAPFPVALQPPAPTRRRPRPKMKLPPFDFVPSSCNVSSLPPSFYPQVPPSPHNDARVGLWKQHALSACASRRGARRAQNEDRVFCDHLNRIYGVCDGHGAAALPHAPREQLAANTVRELLPRLLLKMPVRDAFEHVDRVVLSKFDERCIVGTTVALVRVFDATRVMQVAHVGDSRVVIIGADARARTLTDDHSPLRADEMARIERDGGYVLRGRVNDILAVSRAIGDSLLKYVVPPTPDVSKYALRDDDQLVVVATDGLWDVMDEQQVAAVCRALPQRDGALAVPLDLQRAADGILAKAREFGSGDDTTVVLVDVRKGARR